MTLDAALQRLSQALTRLEDAVERRLEADDAVAGHAIEVQALAEDRARLAQELDESFARYAQIQTANKDASRRLDQAIAFLEAQGRHPYLLLDGEEVPQFKARFGRASPPCQEYDFPDGDRQGGHDEWHREVRDPVHHQGSNDIGAPFCSDRKHERRIEHTDSARAVASDAGGQ